MSDHAMAGMLGLFDTIEVNATGKAAPEAIAPKAEIAFDVIGAAAPKAFFSMVPIDGLAHGYLFSGPAGVGKKTFAQRLAQSILCETPKEGLLGYCGRCTGCTLFAARTHPDYVEAFGTIKIGRDTAKDEGLTARELVRDLSLHGYRSHYRVVVLGDIAFATHEAANALLKFFEEPPAGVIVILTTDAPGSLLDTIRSRFIDVSFGPIATADIEALLIAEGVEPGVARAAAIAGLGSIMRARSVLEDGGGFRTAAFTWFVHTMLGRQPSLAFLELDDKTLTGAQKRARVCDLIEIARTGLRDWIALSLENAPLLAPDQAALLRTLPAPENKRVLGLLGTVGDVERVSKSNVSAGLVVDLLRVTLAPM
jgi:hypothetical protein